MIKYTCSVCGENDNHICTAIGITPPHDCPYNLGGFKWECLKDINLAAILDKPQKRRRFYRKEAGFISR